MELLEGLQAPLQIGEQRELFAASLSPRRDRAQEVSDAGESGDAVFRFQIIENLRLEVCQAQVGESDSAGAARPKRYVALRELGPLAQQPGRFDRGGVPSLRPG